MTLAFFPLSVRALTQANLLVPRQRSNKYPLYSGQKREDFKRLHVTNDRTRSSIWHVMYFRYTSESGHVQSDIREWTGLCDMPSENLQHYLPMWDYISKAVSHSYTLDKYFVIFAVCISPQVIRARQVWKLPRNHHHLPLYCPSDKDTANTCTSREMRV